MSEPIAPPFPYPNAFRRYMRLVHGEQWTQTLPLRVQRRAERQWAFGTQQWTRPFTSADVDAHLPALRAAMASTALYFEMEDVSEQLQARDSGLRHEAIEQAARALQTARHGWAQAAAV